MLCGGFLGRRDVCLQARIPALERGPEVVVQDPRPDLEQQVRSPLGPAHRLNAMMTLVGLPLERVK